MKSLESNVAGAGLILHISERPSATSRYGAAMTPPESVTFKVRFKKATQKDLRGGVSQELEKW